MKLSKNNITNIDDILYCKTRDTLWNNIDTAVSIPARSQVTTGIIREMITQLWSPIVVGMREQLYETSNR